MVACALAHSFHSHKLPPSLAVALSRKVYRMMHVLCACGFAPLLLLLASRQHVVVHASQLSPQGAIGLDDHAARIGARAAHARRREPATPAPHVWHPSTPGVIPVDLPKPAMSAHEFLTAQYYVRGRRTYLEWGSGASTVLLAPLARRAVSVENQASWCAQMNARHDVRFWKVNGVLTFQCVDTGATGKRAKGWG